MSTPLQRLQALRDRLMAMDSGSGEAADLTLALTVIDAAQARLAVWTRDTYVAVEGALHAINTAEPLPSPPATATVPPDDR